MKTPLSKPELSDEDLEAIELAHRTERLYQMLDRAAGKPSRPRPPAVPEMPTAPSASLDGAEAPTAAAASASAPPPPLPSSAAEPSSGAAAPGQRTAAPPSSAPAVPAPDLAASTASVSRSPQAAAAPAAPVVPKASIAAPVQAAPVQAAAGRGAPSRPATPQSDLRAAPNMAPSLPVGRVAFVTGSQVVAIIDDPQSPAASQLQMGALVKMQSGAAVVFGVVSGLSMPLPAEESGQKDMMTLEVELLGEVLKAGDGGLTAFRRGVSSPPQLNAPVLTTVKADLMRVYATPNKQTARVGTLHQDRQVPVHVINNELLGKHFAILGTTGCGKSCATTLMLQAIIEKNPQSHIVLLDPHNEYASAFPGSAEIIDTGNLELPYWMLEFNEFLGVVLGGVDRAEKAEIAILTEALPAVKAQFLRDGGKSNRITVDTPIPYRLTDLMQYIDTAMGKLDKADGSAPYQRLKSRLSALQGDPRYRFMFGGVSVRDNMEKILCRLFRIPVDGKPISILDLSGVPSEVVNVVVSVLCRITFDFAIWADRRVPILLVCEEAHRYAAQGGLGFEPTKVALARIAKEGRKYGVSLCLVSQRPSEIATEILSQCNTVFAMRMTNQFDQEILRAIISDSSQGFEQSLPSLGNGEAIAVGEGVSVPMRLCFDALPEDRRPRSETADFTASWQSPNEDEGFVREIVRRWRAQGR